MNRRAVLKSAERPAAKSFRALLREIIAVRAERKDAERLERLKMNAKAAVAMACEAAGCDEADLDKLETLLASLPPDAQEYASAIRFIGEIKDRAASLPGDLVPPRANLTRKDLFADLAVSCFILKRSPLELVALGTRQATREHPEVFAEGCTDPAKHEQMIADLREREQKLAEEASRAWGFEDVTIELDAVPGRASISFAISDGQVPVTPPDDPRGVGGLVEWLELHPDALEKE